MDDDGILLDRTVRLSRRLSSRYSPMPPDMTVTEWADANRRLSSETSAEAGQWRTSRTPYLAAIMDAFTQPAVHKIAVVASAQVGKTEALINTLGYVIDVDPGPAMWVMPTNDNAEDFSKRRLAPAIRDCAPLRRKVADAKGRSAANTTLKKRFPGGMLTMTGSNSPTNLASVPARYVFGDEIDRWAKDAGGEGNPASLLEARTATFYNSKIVMVSTPTTRGASTIEAEFMLGTQEYWAAKCPHCGECRFITFDNIRFEHEKIVEGSHERFVIGDIAYCCPECGCLSSERDMRDADHEWIAKNPDALASGARSFWINAFSSPWVSWEHIIRRFLEAGDDPRKLKAVFNTLLGQLWEERGEVADADELADAREEYAAELPDGVLCLTCGVDTQDNRLEYEVVGHGLFEETWGIQRGVLWGRPDAPDTDASPNVWHQLDGEVGSGAFDPATMDARAREALVEPVASVAVAAVRAEASGAAVVADMDNSAVPGGAEISEMGLFARAGGRELLFAYGYSEAPETVPPRDEATYERRFVTHVALSSGELGMVVTYDTYQQAIEAALSGGAAVTGVSASAPLSASAEGGAVSLSHAASGVSAGTRGDARAQSPAFGGAFKALSATVNATGHVTAISEHEVTIPSAPATASAPGLMSARDKRRLDMLWEAYASGESAADGLLARAGRPRSTSRRTAARWERCGRRWASPGAAPCACAWSWRSGRRADMFGPFQMSVFESVVGGVTLAAVLGMWTMLLAFIKRQNAANNANKEFMRSMQRSQLAHAFQRHVEDGKPMSIEELSHVDACYKAYHDNGGNGTGTLMYERIKEHAVLVTHVEDENTIELKRGSEDG